MEQLTTTYFPLFLFLIASMAFMYASVGHGGASGYIAILALFSIEPSMIKSSALILNIFVSLISFILYYREGHFKFALFLPFAITSIPASLIGAMIPLSANFYKKIIALCLIFPILKLVGIIGTENNELKKLNIPYALLLGAIIGLLSGMLGIGGGIILSPIILLFHWANMKETAAVSSLFIFVNSIAGLIGLGLTGFVFSNELYPWLMAAIIGGFSGAYLGSKKLKTSILKYLLAAVLIVASVKLLLT